MEDMGLLIRKMAKVTIFLLFSVLLFASNFTDFQSRINLKTINENDFPVEINNLKNSRHRRQIPNASERKLLSENINRLRENAQLYEENSESGPTELQDVFISVKTSSKFHKTRLPVILKTWWTKAKNQVYFFTDSDDERLSNITSGHVVNTHCESSHNRQDLSCKMGAEYDAFMKSGKRWWCHFDDDNYVNVGQLVKTLNHYNHERNVYLGKPSLGHAFQTYYQDKMYEFWFATGGAGVCLSLKAAKSIAPWARDGEFMKTADDLKLPDDVTLGFIISGKAKIELTHCRNFHSHLEQLSTVATRDLPSQVSLSYHDGGSGGDLNTVDIEERKALFTKHEDPTRFLSLHCLIYPYTSWCK